MGWSEIQNESLDHLTLAFGTLEVLSSHGRLLRSHVTRLSLDAGDYFTAKEFLDPGLELGVPPYALEFDPDEWAWLLFQATISIPLYMANGCNRSVSLAFD